MQISGVQKISFFGVESEKTSLLKMVHVFSFEYFGEKEAKEFLFKYLKENKIKTITKCELFRCVYGRAGYNFMLFRKLVVGIQEKRNLQKVVESVVKRLVDSLARMLTIHYSKIKGEKSSKSKENFFGIIMKIFYFSMVSGQTEDITLLDSEAKFIHCGVGMLKYVTTNIGSYFDAEKFELLYNFEEISKRAIIKFFSEQDDHFKSLIVEEYVEKYFLRTASETQGQYLEGLIILMILLYKKKFLGYINSITGFSVDMEIDCVFSLKGMKNLTHENLFQKARNSIICPPADLKVDLVSGMKMKKRDGTLVVAVKLGGGKVHNDNIKSTKELLKFFKSKGYPYVAIYTGYGNDKKGGVIKKGNNWAEVNFFNGEYGEVLPQKILGMLKKEK